MRYRWLLCVVIATLAPGAAGTVCADNRKSLKKLAVGMTSDEVDTVMGTETYVREQRATGGTGTKVRRASKEKTQNPYRIEAHQTAEHSFIVLLYYAERKKRDGKISDNELTPVVLKDGLVDGWGWSHWNGLVKEYEIPLP